jgi:tetratricopeptide (TPR) repeat protein
MAHVWLALTFTDLGRLRDARDAFQRAYDADPLSPIIGSNLGFALAKTGEYEVARELFERVLEIAPEFTVAHAGMAQVARRLGQPEEARKWWEHAGRINPQRSYYPASLAMLQLEIDELDAAEQALQRAESIAPNDPLVVRTRMAVLIATDRRGELCSYTEGRLAGERSGAETLANAALAQLIAGQPARAIQYYERVQLDLGQWTRDSLVWSWRFPHGIHSANAFALTGEEKRASALLDDADGIHDRLEQEGLVNPDLDYQRAAVLALRGSHDAAAGMLARARERGLRAQWWQQRDPALAGLRASIDSVPR